VPTAFRRKKSNVFGWSVTILLLTGFASRPGSAAFTFSGTERPQSLRILKKLHKTADERFELTAAPPAKFLIQQLNDRTSC